MGMRTTLLLLLVIAGLGGVLWITSKEPPREESAEMQALDGRLLSQCARFRWQFKDVVAYEMRRRDDGMFEMVEPIVDRASRGYLQQIVEVWDSARLIATEMQDDDNGRRETGLVEPELTFFAEWADGHTVSYDLGAPGPLGTDRFLRREGKIWRGGNGLFESMRVNQSDLRDRQVFAQQEPFCRGLRVEHRARTGKREVLELQRRESEWRLTQPYDGRAEPNAARRFVTAVLSLRADQFLGGMIRRPEREPEVRVVAQGGNGDEVLEIWIDAGAAYGPLPGRTGWFQCDPRTFEGVFERAVDEIRSKTLVSMGVVAQELAEIVVDPGQGRGDRVRLLRRSVSAEAGWRLVEPVAFEAAATPTNEAVQAVNNLQALEFVDGKSAADAELGLGGAERVQLTVRSFEQRSGQTIWFGKTTQSGDLELVYACRADEPDTVVLVPKPAVDKLVRPWMSYCELDVTRIPVQVGRIELQRGEESRVYGIIDGKWQQQGTGADGEDIGYFVNDNLRDLRGTRALDCRESALGPPDWTLTLSRENSDPLQQLRVWERAGAATLAVQPGNQDDVAFELNKFISKQLRALWQ